MNRAAARPLTLAVDAMGGDRAPQMVIEGMSRALDSLKSVRFLLFGRTDEVAPLVERCRRLRSCVEVRHADDVVASGERPSIALRAGRNSSMRHAIDAVASGDADGAVSAGNTGALMAMAKFVFKTLAGRRPSGDCCRFSFAARPHRAARSRRQRQLRCPEPGAVRRHGRGVRPQRAGIAATVSRAAERRRGGSEGQRRGEEGRRNPPAEQARHSLPRLRRGLRYRHGHCRRRRYRRLQRQHRA